MQRIAIALAAIPLMVGKLAFATVAATEPRQFVDRAAQLSMFESAAAKLALDKSRSFAVKEFAFSILLDQERVRSELIGLCKRLGISLPRELDAEFARKLQSLRDSPLDRFDANYIEQLITSQEKAQALYQLDLPNAVEEISAFSSSNVERVSRRRQAARSLANLIEKSSPQ
jgi:putative membrane protein